jgi:hypothetical protein
MSRGVGILAAGDSHSLFWRGRDTMERCESLLDGVEAFHLGGATAYNIANEDSPRAARLRRHLTSHRQSYGLLITCFGEIDCRTHVVKQAELQGRSIEDVAAEVATRYFGFVVSIQREFDIPVAIFGPPPSTPPERRLNNHEYPTRGTIVERNRAIATLGETLRSATAIEPRLAYFSVLDALIDEEGKTKPDALFDGVHLSVRHMPLALARLDNVLTRLGLEALKPVLRTSEENEQGAV